MERPTHGTAVPVLPVRPRRVSAQLLGTVHGRRGRWNPFLPDNDMHDLGDGRFVQEVWLQPDGGRHGDGVYALRFALDHRLDRLFKADVRALDAQGRPRLVSGEAATRAHNVMLRVHTAGWHRIVFEPALGSFDVNPAVDFLTTTGSMQLNGFVWDEEDMFTKFDERRPNHEMQRRADRWELTVPLRRDGGIASRRDGVYQFSFSVDGNEDGGFGGDNREPGRLSGGTGFGSSGGRSIHSALTLSVSQDGEYTFRVDPERFRFEVVPAPGLPPPRLLNAVPSVQLLGTVHAEAPYDPRAPGRDMEEYAPRRWRKTLDVRAGVHAINFALGRELFLDTMALGAWLEPEDPRRLRGRAWHGKPNEPNILFELLRDGTVCFEYDGDADEFALETAEADLLRPVTTLDTLGLVGDFDAPLVPWDPTAPANDMQRLGPSLFLKEVELQGGRTYAYKYVANRYRWLWTFADYELDGYGRDFEGRNPCVGGAPLHALRRWGHLTTHADPPALTVEASRTGRYAFVVDLETGAYAVHRMD